MVRMFPEGGGGGWGSFPPFLPHYITFTESYLVENIGNQQNVYEGGAASPLSAQNLVNTTPSDYDNKNIFINNNDDDVNGTLLRKKKR